MRVPFGAGEARTVPWWGEPPPQRGAARQRRATPWSCHHPEPLRALKGRNSIRYHLPPRGPFLFLPAVPPFVIHDNTERTAWPPRLRVQRWHTRIPLRPQVVFAALHPVPWGGRPSAETDRRGHPPSDWFPSPNWLTPNWLADLRYNPYLFSMVFRCAWPNRTEGPVRRWPLLQADATLCAANHRADWSEREGSTSVANADMLGIPEDFPQGFTQQRRPDP